MDQLMLLEDPPTLDREVERFAAYWTTRCGGGPHTAEAARVTSARFADWRGRSLTARERERASAYFGAVVRRLIIGSPDALAVSARRRLVAVSIEADLRSAGWSAERASHEAARATGQLTRRGAA